MKKLLLLTAGLLAFSVASFAGSVSTQCLFPGSITTIQFNAAVGSATATCAGALSLGIDGAVNILTQVQVFIESDYQNCGTFANPCTSADVRLTYTPGAGGNTWTATSGTFCAANQACEDVTGQISSALYQVNQTGASAVANQFLLAAQDLSNLASFNNSWSELVASALMSVAPPGQTPVTSSAQVAVVYTYSSPTGTPEPFSMGLFGSGLVALSLLGRKKLARK